MVNSLQDDAELARLHQEYVDLENLLTEIRVAHVAGKPGT